MVNIDYLGSATLQALDGSDRKFKVCNLINLKQQSFYVTYFFFIVDDHSVGTLAWYILLMVG
jgi:hypothetical protein